MIDDLVGVAHIVRLGKILERKKCIICSNGISRKIARQLSFIRAQKLQDALNIGESSFAKLPKIAVIKNGGAIIPILEK